MFNLPMVRIIGIRVSITDIHVEIIEIFNRVFYGYERTYLRWSQVLAGDCTIGVYGRA